MDAEDQLQRSKMEKEREARREVLAYNARYKEVQQHQSMQQRMQDEYLLKYALQKEAEAVAAEDEKRNANKAAAAQYRRYLEEQMVKEAEDNSAIDDIRRTEEERVWNARDAALDARQRARDELRRQVDEGRMEQMEYRRRAQLLEEEEDRIYAAKFIIDAKDGIAMEREEERQRRDINMENKSKLEQQIQLRRMREEREKQDTYLENKHMQYVEKMHQKKLQEQGGMVRTFRPLKQSQWYS